MPGQLSPTVFGLHWRGLLAVNFEKTLKMEIKHCFTNTAARLRQIPRGHVLELLSTDAFKHDLPSVLTFFCNQE